MKTKIFNKKIDFVSFWKFRKSIIKCIFHKKRLLNFLLVQYSKIFRRTESLGLPLAVNIEPTNRCNLNCIMCKRTYLRPKRETDLSFESYKKIIDEIGDYLFFLFLWNWGEPLLNRDLHKMIEYAKRKGIFTVLSTNGLLLNKKNIVGLIDSRLDYIIIGIDAATEKTYSKYKRGGSFRKLTANIKNLVLEKNRRNSFTPYIDLQFIVMRDNESETTRINSLGRKLGVDKVSLKKVIMPEENIRQQLLPKNSEFVMGIYKGEKDKRKCLRPWYSCVMNSEGSVIPCCHDLNSNYNFGNVFREPFKKIWNNKSYRKFRWQILENRRISICDSCLGRNFSADSFVL